MNTKEQFLSQCFAFIFRFLRLLIAPIDGPLILGMLSLMGISLLILYSAQSGWSPLLYKQILHDLLALGVVVLVSHLPPRLLYHNAPYLFALTCLMLTFVLITGHVGKGAQRWLTIGWIRFEPSEVMKISLPLLCAWFLHQRPWPLRSKSILYTLGLIALPSALVLKQPDLGTSIILAFTGLMTLFLAGLSWRWVLSGCSTLLLMIPLFWHTMHTYQKERVLTFLNPERDPLGSGYHTIQAKIAIGSGGLSGKGWQQGTQAHLHFLPEHTTDFIFALWAEEFGLIGSCLLLLIFLSMSVRMITLSAHRSTPFKQILTGALSFLFTLSYVINIGMVCGVLPVVGVPLPIISYGGSALLIMAILIGIISSCQHHHTFD